MRQRSIRATTAIFVLPVLVLAGCGGDDDDAAEVTTTLPPLGTTTAPPLVTTTLPVDAGATTTTAPAVGAGGTYVVESGDTLSGIADRFGVSLADLATANGFDPTDEESMQGLQIGDELVIPAVGATTAATTATTAATTATTVAVDPAATTTTV